MLREQQYQFGLQLSGPSSSLRAWRDFIDGVYASAIWGVLGWQDIKQRYRRSVLGPFWLTISTAIMIAALGFVYAGIFNQRISDYIPFVGVGLIVWGLISSIFNESPTVFVAAEGMIKQIRLPFTTHVCRMVWRNIIIFAHNGIILLVIYFFFGKGWHIDLITLPIALLVLAINGVAVGIILGIFCTRYRDIAQIVANIVQLTFFITPIMWDPKVLADRKWIADFNPIFHFIELMRAPILGNAFPATSWVVVALITLAMIILALLSLIRFRHRIAYWL